MSSAGGRVEKFGKDRRNAFSDMKKDHNEGRKFKKPTRGKNRNYEDVE